MNFAFNKTSFLASCAMLVPLMSSELMAYVAAEDSSYIFELAQNIYLALAEHFPFSTISAHSAASAYSHSIEYGMMTLWILSPAIFAGSIFKYSEKLCVNWSRKEVVSFRVFIMICILGIVMGIFSLLCYMPDATPSLCRGCETRTIFLAIFIKYVYFWMIGFCVGQILSAFKKRKAWHE